MTGEASLLPVAPTTEAKFVSTGEARPYPGITVLTDLVPDEGTQDHLAKISAQLAVAPSGAAHRFLPYACLHMTLFRCINDRRRTPDEWPQNAPLDLPLDRMTALIYQRLEGCEIPNKFRLRPVALTQNPTGELQLALVGADNTETRRLHEARRDLSTRLRLRQGETGYGHHVTLSYRVRPALRADEAALARTAAALFDTFVSAHPVLTVQAPSLCLYQDMLSFRPILPLAAPA